MNNSLLDLLEEYSNALVRLLDEEESINYFQIKNYWYSVTNKLYVYTIKNKCDNIFPLTLDKQLELITTPINDWGIELVDDYLNKPLLEKKNNNYELTELAIDLSKNYNCEATEPLSELQRFILENNLNSKLYTEVRKKLIKYPVIKDNSKLIWDIREELSALVDDNIEMFLELKFNSPEIMSFFTSFYQDAPLGYNDFMDQKIYRCPYCNYPLRVIKQDSKRDFKCLHRKCLKRGGGRDEIRAEKVNKKDLFYVLQEEVAYYVTIPGIPELKLYDKLKGIKDNYKLEVELYPEADKADLLIEFEDQNWAIDVKDWAYPYKLSETLNKEDDFLKGLDYDLGFLVVPNDVEEKDLNIIEAQWNQSAEYEVLRVEDVIELVKAERGGEINEG
ncbi:hypothetical protein MWH25_02270 [Natroniella acetigena]|uniref:restriction endonuclease-related protein n=1 Tax=Natroniella acetigena TaxID=52004 RepID=UPI00200A4607|nr:hypothetical protein [Natroniella acetigena]MCK8826575.1 hypothetical protein [Natroniella acetigena]